MSDLLPAEDGLYSLGSATRRWLDGYLKGRLGVGSAPGDNRFVASEPLQGDISPLGTTYNLIYASFNQARLLKGLGTLYGLFAGGLLDVNSYTVSAIRGFFFSPGLMNKGANPVTIPTFEGATIGAGFSTLGTTELNVTSRTFLRLYGTTVPALVTIETQRGVYIPNLPTSPNATNIGIDIDNQTTGTIRKLLRAKGSTQSNLEIDADDPPNLGLTTEAESALLISFNENGTPTVRKVRWKQQDQLAATDKVLVAA